MSSTSELASFAARLRLSLRASTWGTRTPFDCAPNTPGEDFERLALELFALQFKHNAPYRRLCEARGVEPANVPHWAEIPAAPTSAFKELDLTCLPAAERMTFFQSLNPS